MTKKNERPEVTLSFDVFSEFEDRVTALSLIEYLINIRKEQNLPLEELFLDVEYPAITISRKMNDQEFEKYTERQNLTLDKDRQLYEALKRKFEPNKVGRWETDKDRDKFHYVYGETHSIKDEPSAIYSDATKFWHKEGIIHRETGPARIRNGVKEYWFEGTHYPEITSNLEWLMKVEELKRKIYGT